MKKILVVEDDRTTNEVTSTFLSEAGYQVVSVFDGEQAIQKFTEEDFSLIILDVMLPKLGGIEVLKVIRETSDIPVILLTALNDEYSQVLGFMNEIDDYVTKPFSPSILVKRVEAVLRRTSTRSNHASAEIFRTGVIVLDWPGKMVTVNGKVVQLTKKELHILYNLVKFQGIVVTRERLLDEIWGYEDFPNDRVIDAHIKNLRKKIPELVFKTIKGIGYLFEGDSK